jgi:hypothetical protein
VHLWSLLIAASVKRNERDCFKEVASDFVCAINSRTNLLISRIWIHNVVLRSRAKKLFVYNIAREPDKRHSLKIVFAISGDLTLDQKEAALVQALEQIVGREMRGLLSRIQSDSHSETEAGRLIFERHDPPEGAEPFRLVVGREDENSYVEWGTFETVASALEGETIIGVDADELNTLRTWFAENLERPTSYGLIKLRHGVCRFKAPASEHVRRIWQMVRIFEHNAST